MGLTKNKFSLLSLSPEADHATWPDINAKADLCVANCYSLARENIDFGYFPNCDRSVRGLPK